MPALATRAETMPRPTHAMREQSLKIAPVSTKRPATKLRQLRLVILELSFTTLLAIFTFYYLYQTLVAEQPRLGLLSLSPTRAINVINILTAALATFLLLIIKQLWDLLRLQLLGRKHGIRATHFLDLSATTSPEGQLILILKRGMHWIWTWQKYVPKRYDESPLTCQNSASCPWVLSPNRRAWYAIVSRLDCISNTIP
jgi:hypothetical protein